MQQPARDLQLKQRKMECQKQVTMFELATPSVPSEDAQMRSTTRPFARSCNIPTYICLIALATLETFHCLRVYMVVKLHAH